MIVRALDLLHSKVLPAAVSKYTTCHGTRPNPSPPTISILKIVVITTLHLLKQQEDISQSITTIHFTVTKALQYTGHNDIN